MLPAFDIQGGAPLALARGLSDAGLLSAFGALAFRAVVAPRALASMPSTADAIRRRLSLLTNLSLAVTMLGLLAWLVAQSADMAGVVSLAAVRTVLAGTRFGHVIALQFVATLAAAVARRAVPALPLAAAALALQAGHSHAASMYDGPSLLLACVIVHLIAAGAWLGGLAPLLLVVRHGPAKTGAAAARWFSPMGKLCVAALTATSLFQGWVLVDSIPGLMGTAYGWMALVKLALFGVLFAFAWVNRYRLAPALLRTRPDQACRTLARSIAVQTGFGLAIVTAATVLSSLPPSMHEQPVWPFAHQFTLETIGEDADFRNEVLYALAALAAAASLLGAALALRRLRLPAAAIAALVAWFAIPHLDLLFVPAYPTSFYRSPTGFAVASIVQGAALYPAHCAACHGADGHGDGPAAANLPVPPADLTAAHLWMHSDGELFWWLAHGIPAPDGRLAMPGFAAALPDDERWNLIDAIRAHNAGLVFHASGAWSPPLQAPGLQARCADGATVSLTDLRGSVVRLVFGAAPPAAGVTTILADPAATPSPGICVADDAALPAAYAIVAGLPPTELPGAQFLIDGAGWLRAMQRAPGWTNPAQLAAELHGLAAHPIAAMPSMALDMRM